MPKVNVTQEDLVTLRRLATKELLAVATALGKESANKPVDAFTSRIAELKQLVDKLDDMNVQP